MIKKILTLFFLFQALASASTVNPPIIWETPYARTLTSYISMNDNVYLLQGNVNPSSVATSAPIGSLYLSYAGSVGTLYVKQDAGSSTNWTALSASGNYITALTGDVSATGPGSVAATVNSVGGSSAAAINTATTLVNGSQSGSKFLGSPSGGGSGTPAFRALVGSDLPNPSSSTLGGIESYAAVSNQWINQISTSGVPSSSQPAFSNISGTVAASQLPNPSATTLGGVESYAPISHQWINTISTSGVPSSTQPAFSDISGTASAAQLPNPTATTLGGIESLAAVSHNWINQISTSGVPSATQPAFSDISGSVAASQMPALTGDVTTSAGAVATTVAKIAGTTVSGTTGTTNSVFSNGPAITGAWTHTDAGSFINAADATKVLALSLSGMTASRTLTLASAQSTSQTLNLPNITGSDTLATLGLAQTFSGALTLSASNTALTVNNNATISGVLGVGQASSSSASISTGNTIGSGSGSKFGIQTNNTYNTSGTIKDYSSAPTFATTAPTQVIDFFATSPSGSPTPAPPMYGFYSTIANVAGNYSFYSSTATPSSFGGAVAVNAASMTGTGLNVTGTSYFASLGTVTPGTNGALCLSSSNQMGANAANCISSLLAYKEEIQKMDPLSALNTIIALADSSVYYRYKKSFIGNVPNVTIARAIQPGFIADWVEKSDPRYVLYNDKGDLAGVRYEQITATLAAAVKELELEIIDLRSQMKAYQKREEEYVRRASTGKN